MAMLDHIRSPRGVRDQSIAAGLELALVAVFFLVYRAGRSLAAGEHEAATAHAQTVHRFEGWIHLPSEAWLQSLVPDQVLHAANYYYCSVHFPVTIAFLVWGWTRRPHAEYVWARNLLMAVTSAGLLIHIVFPLAPPRMFPQWGFVDTMARFGPDAYSGASGEAANQFAAMPSLHIGWALIIAYVVCRTGNRVLKTLAVSHVVLTTLVVVVTANHYWLDGLVAAALVTAFALVLPVPREARVVAPAVARGAVAAR
jgi:hypothetical protein